MSVGEGDVHPYNMSAAMPEPKTQESVFQHTHTRYALTAHPSSWSDSINFG